MDTSFGAAAGPASQDLAGYRLLVVEDEYLIAREVAQALRRAGAFVIGPAPTVAAALDLLASEGAPDAALLDINLRGEMAYPVADALAGRGVPVVFATGYNFGSIPDRYAGVPRCDKPAEARTIVKALQNAIGAAPTPEAGRTVTGG